MAALQKIRSKSTLLIVIISIGLLAFVFPWGEVRQFVARFEDKAFTVNGDIVPTGKYSERIAEWENFERIMSNSSSLDETTTAQIREATYQQMVKEMMLDDQAERLGLAVTSEELSDMVYGANVSPMLYGIPLFANPQTNQFDQSRLIAFLSEINQNVTTLNDEQKAEILAKKRVWAFIENMLKYRRLEEKYSSLVAGTFLVNNTESKAVYEDSKNVANIAYVVEKYATMPDSLVQVTDKEIKALYDKRKNNFKQETDLRKVSYFIKDVVPSEEDFAVVEKEMNAVVEKLKTSDNPAAVVSEYSASPYIDAFMSVSTLPVEAKTFVQSAAIGDIYGPVRNDQSFIMYKLVDKTMAADSIKLQIIPLPQGLDEKTSAHIADSLYNVIKGGADFAAVAEQVMPGSNGGQLGWVNEMMLASAGIAEECFKAAKGEVLKLSISGQTQLVRIEDKTNPVSKVKLAVVQMPVVISDKTQNTIDNELNQFVTESGNLENFDKGARAKGYNLIANTLIAPSEMTLGQASGSRQVIHWAFNEKTGSVKKFDMSDKRIVAIIKEHIDAGYMPVSEVSDMLKAELIRDKKAEVMINNLKSKNLQSLDAYAQAVSGKVDTVNYITFQTNNIMEVGYEPILNVYSKLGQVNKLEAPLKGLAGVYMINLVSKTEDTKPYNSEEIKASIRQGSSYQLMSESLNALRSKMEVKDNRVKFY